MIDLIELTEDEWFDTYKPLPNYIDDNASFDGHMFETYGDELEFIKAQDSNRIWTYADGDEGGLYISSGWHVVNRIGYFITAVPFDEKNIYQVTLDMGEE